MESGILVYICICSACYIQTKSSFSGVELTLETPELRRIHMQTTDDNEMLHISSFLCYFQESVKYCTLNFQVLLERKLH